jgi:hypothetical protein
MRCGPKLLPGKAVVRSDHLIERVLSRRRRRRAQDDETGYRRPSDDRDDLARADAQHPRPVPRWQVDVGDRAAWSRGAPALNGWPRTRPWESEPRSLTYKSDHNGIAQ